MRLHACVQPLLRGSVWRVTLAAGLAVTLAPSYQLLQKLVTKLKSDSVLGCMCSHTHTHITNECEILHLYKSDVFSFWSGSHREAAVDGNSSEPGADGENINQPKNSPVLLSPVRQFRISVSDLGASRSKQCFVWGGKCFPGPLFGSHSRGKDASLTNSPAWVMTNSPLKQSHIRPKDLFIIRIYFCSTKLFRDSSSVFTVRGQESVDCHEGFAQQEAGVEEVAASSSRPTQGNWNWNRRLGSDFPSAVWLSAH